MAAFKIFLYKIFVRFSSALGKKRRAVFLDRDGTLNCDSGYVGEEADFKLLPGTIPALKKLFENDFLLIVITNQSGVGRGYFKMKDVKKIHGILEKKLAGFGIYLAKIYVCPHRPEENCPCRKPKPYFFQKAAREFNLKKEECFSVGDKPTDAQAAKAAGIKPFTLGEDFASLKDAADFIAKK